MIASDEAVPVIAAIALVAAAGTSCGSDDARVRQPTIVRSCSSTIYTSETLPIRRSDAVFVGPLAFPTLRGLSSPSKLSRVGKFFVYKSPATLGPRPASKVTLMLTNPRSGVRLLYDPADLRRLANGTYRIGSTSKVIEFRVCRYSGRPLYTQYNGGFLLRKPSCAILAVQDDLGNEAGPTRVPLGVPDC
jgi:hypothetical protein